MKQNDPHRWTVALYGEGATSQRNFRQETVVGDIQTALNTADELESEVDFEVLQYVIRRHELANGGHEP